MGDKGKRDKGGREKQKPPAMTQKERKKLKREKKNKTSVGGLPQA